LGDKEVEPPSKAIPRKPGADQTDPEARFLLTGDFDEDSYDEDLSV